MRNVSTRDSELVEKILRRIDRKITFDALRLEDGDIELRLTHGRLNTMTRFSAAALEASASDVTQFEALRGKIKRVFDRMHVPAPPIKAPKVEIQKDVSWFRPGGGGGRGGRR